MFFLVILQNINIFAAQLEDIIQNIKLKLSNPQDIVILSHRNPDGDAVGSTIALKRFLDKLNHKVKIIFPSEYPSTFEYLIDSNDKPLIFDLDNMIAFETIKKATVIFCLDFNALDRIDRMGETVMFSKATKIMIDHHIDPEPFCDYVISDTMASSTSELVYLFIKAFNQMNMFHPSIGDAILTGIITDTGSFKFGTRPLTYTIAGELKSFGVDDYDIQNRIHNSQDPKYLRLLGHCLANRMVLIPEYQAGYIYLTKEDYTEFSIGRGDTEGIVNYLMMLSSIKIAAFITEQPTIIKISLRSKGDINVQQICHNHFNGGGHKNASGGSAYAKLDDVISRFVKVLPTYIKIQ
jgi:bifunctional oligoribonuclease and PAP phosphatase NrnA